MRGLGCLFSLLLMGAGLVLLAMFLIVPSVPSWTENADLNNIYASLFCGSGESLEREVYTSQYYKGTNYSMKMWCVNDDHVRTNEVTNTALFLGIGGFTITFIIGTVIGIISFVAQQKAALARIIHPNQAGGIIVSVGGKTLEMGHTPSSHKKYVITDSSDAEYEDYSHKLKELQESYDQGLITREEYDRARQDILKRMSR